MVYVIYVFLINLYINTWFGCSNAINAPLLDINFFLCFCSSADFECQLLIWNIILQHVKYSTVLCTVLNEAWCTHCLFLSLDTKRLFRVYQILSNIPQIHFACHFHVEKNIFRNVSKTYLSGLKEKIIKNNIKKYFFKLLLQCL